MNKKTITSIVAASFLAGAGGAKAVGAIGPAPKIHAIEFKVYGDGSVHRNVSALRSTAEGVISLKCDDEKAQARLQAELRAAQSECAAP